MNKNILFYHFILNKYVVQKKLNKKSTPTGKDKFFFIFKKILMYFLTTISNHNKRVLIFEQK